MEKADAMMRYTIGKPIPEEDILRRFKDEDNDIFIEVRGLPDVFFRVTEENRVYYKIDKSKMQNETLTLVDDFSHVKPKPQYSWDDNDSTSLPLSGFENPFDLDDLSIEGTGSSTQLSRSPLDKKTKQIDLQELEEGKILPDKLKPLCKPNGYGGYSLRHEKNLYMLDGNYRIELITMDSIAHEEFEIEQNDFNAPPFLSHDTVSELDSSWGWGPNVEFHRGDTLPANFRPQCEAELGSGGGSRITIGNYLYILTPHYKIAQKMKLSIFDDLPTQPQDTSSNSKKENNTPSQDIHLAPPIIIDNLVKNVETAITQFQINADFFKESVLCPANRPILLNAYNGDLSQLNDDTREATSNGERTIINENGFNLFKAALIHEFYIKTTLTGRGNKMKFFLTHILASQPDGTLKEIDHDNLTLEEQKRRIENFQERAEFYPDKCDIIKRVYRTIRKIIYAEYKEMWYSHEKVWFNALLIAKLYEEH